MSWKILVQARALTAFAGWKSARQNTFWSDRYGVLEDPFGYHWSVATYIHDVISEELLEGARKSCS